MASLSPFDPNFCIVWRTDMNPLITLSKPTVEFVIEACETVQQRNPKNEISVSMCNGLAERVAEHGNLSEKQAIWLCRNLDFWKLARPSKLKGVVVPSRPVTPQAAPANVSGDVLSQILD